MNRLDTNPKSIFNPTTTANIRLAVFAIVAVILMMLDHRSQHLAVARNALATAVYPIQYLAQLPIDLAHWSHQALTSRQQLQAELNRLRQNQLSACVFLTIPGGILSVARLY